MRSKVSVIAAVLTAASLTILPVVGVASETGPTAPERGACRDPLFQVGSSVHAPSQGSLLLAQLQPIEPTRIDTAEIEFTALGCTVTDDCPGGGTIQCSGTTCSTATWTCPDGGSTCPEQGGTTKAVKCDGAIQDHCPCPQVCYGCDEFCRDSTDCKAICSCGPGFCVGGSCTCPH